MVQIEKFAKKAKHVAAGDTEIFTKGSRWFIGPTEALLKPRRASEGPRGAGSTPNVNLTMEGGQKREAQAPGWGGGVSSCIPQGKWRDGEAPGHRI